MLTYQQAINSGYRDFANHEFARAYSESTGIYATRYRANKHARYGDVIVRIGGGYMIMSASDYRIWRKQR
jgi:hypothetical protein